MTKSDEVLLKLSMRLEALEREYPGILHPDVLDFLQVFENGAKKYALNNWLESDGSRTAHKEMHDSMFHHLAESYAGIVKDKDSGLDPLLHLATRAVMLYIRRKNGIKHPLDK